MFASCMMLCLVFMIVSGEVKSSKELDNIQMSNAFLPLSNNSRRKPLEIDKNENQKLTNVLLKTDQDPHIAESSVKIKRSSNPRAISDLKLRIQRRRTEALCKFCRKSALRMKRALCKRCAQIIPSTSEQLTTIQPPAILRHRTLIANKKLGKPSPIKLNAPVRKLNAFAGKDKRRLLQLKHNSNNVRSSENTNNEIHNEKFLLSNTHKSKSAINNKLIKNKLNNTNKNNFEISQKKLTNIKNKLFPSKFNLSNVSPTIKTKPYTISQNNIKKINLNITTKPNLQNIRKKLFPVKSSDINTNTKLHPLKTNSNILHYIKNDNTDKKAYLNSRLLKFPLANEQIESNLDSSLTMQRNSEQDKIRTLLKTGGRKLLTNNLIKTKNTSENDKKEHVPNVIGNNKRIDLQNSRLPIENGNSRLLNILTSKTNLHQATFTDAHDNGSSNLENVRSKRLKTISNIKNTTNSSTVQLENTLHSNEPVVNELKYNKNRAKFSENSVIKKKSAFNIDLNRFELPLFETATAFTERKYRPLDENLPLSRVKFSSRKTNGRERKFNDELTEKTPKKNDGTTQIEIPAKKIQNFDRVVRENNITLLRPSGSSVNEIQEGITENINEEHVLGKTKSDIKLRENVHLTEDEVSDTTEINNREKIIPNNKNKTESEKHKNLKINIEKRSTIQSFTNPRQSDVSRNANNTMMNTSSDQKSTEQTTPESLVTKVQLRSQHFLNRKVYLKHPRLMSTYEDGKHKYVLKMPPKPPYYTSYKWDISGMPMSVSTTTVNTVTSTSSELSTTINTAALETAENSSVEIKEKLDTDTDSRKEEIRLQEHIPNSVLNESQNRRNIHVNHDINIKSNMSETSQNGNEQNILDLNKANNNATNIRKESDVMKHLRSQTFLNRNVYLKHPRLKSVYENGKHKYVLKDPPRPPYISKYNLNSADLRQNVLTTTEYHDFTSTESNTEKYPMVTKTINTISNTENSVTHQISNNTNNNSEKEIVKNTLSQKNITTILDTEFQTTQNYKLRMKNNQKIQNKTDITSGNFANLNENNEENYFEYSVTTESDSSRTSSTTDTFNINTHLRPQHFLNRKIYLKHPRIASVYENGQHKYILREPPRPPYQTKFKWDILGMPLTTSATIEPIFTTINVHQTTDTDIHDSVSTTKNNNIQLESARTENDIFDILKNNNNSDENKNKDLTNTKTIAIPFSESQNTKLHEVDADLRENKREDFKRYLKNKLISSNFNDNRNMYLDDEISENSNQDIFWKYLNMYPEINQDKYKNIPVTDNKEHKLKKKRMNLLRNTNKSIESEKNSIPINLENITPDRLLKSENKINLPLVLKQTGNGGFELVLDTNRMCNCSKCGQDKHYGKEENYLVSGEEKELSCPCMVHDPKILSKRKIEENLNKNPLNIFNILKHTNDMSSTQINNFLQTAEENKMKYNLNEQYLRFLIENRLLKLFHSLKIPVENVHEIYSYVNDLPSQEKQVLENYLLNTVTNNFGEESNFEEFKNRFLQNMPSYLHSRFSQSQLNSKPANANDIPERTTEGNYRIQLKMDSEESEDFRQNSDLNDMDIKSLIKEQIKKELRKMIKDDTNKIQFLSDNSLEYGKRNKVLSKRHQDFFDEDINDSSSDVNPHGIIKRKYKIVNNILNWARDCIVKP